MKLWGLGSQTKFSANERIFQKMNASSEDLSASTQNVCVHGRNSSALAGWCLACCLLVLGWIVLWLLWCLAGSALLLVGWLVSVLSDLLLVCCIWCSLQCSRQATGNRQQATEPVSKYPHCCPMSCSSHGRRIKTLLYVVFWTV